MYSMKSFSDVLMNIDLPTCMYRMKPLTFLYEFPETKDQNLEKLLQRQDCVLARIDILKEKIDGLTKKFAAESFICKNEIEDITHRPLQCRKPQTEGLRSFPCEDLVIRASPADPPISLFILKSFLREQENILCNSFVHSSIEDKAEKQKLGSENCSDRSGYKYAVTIIWTKYKGTPCLITSPTKDIHLLGEFVIARHLAHLIPTFESLDFDMMVQIDDFLDLASSFKLTGYPAPKDVLARLEKNLARSNWLVGNSISLADIALWSILYTERKAFGKLPKSVDKWYNTCSALDQFKHLP